MAAPILSLALRPAQRLVWNSLALRARNLLRFAETEADGGRDLARAAETTSDPLLRRLFIFHAQDEQRHAELFRKRGMSLLSTLAPASRRSLQADWLNPGERGLDDLKVGEESDASLLAFLHLSEKSAAEAFAVYRDLLVEDAETRAVFEQILNDETFHMNYTLAQLKRVSRRGQGWRLWRARLSRLWKGYLRIAAAIASVISRVVLTILYFVLLPPFAWMAKADARRDPPGWAPVTDRGVKAMKGQY
jgi:rubrerythrin